MRRFLYTLGFVGALAVAVVAQQVGNPNTSIYTEQGGDRMVVGSGGSLDVASGGELDVESGGSLKIAGTAVTASAAELNALASSGVSAAEYAKLNGLAAAGYLPVTEGCLFTEDATSTTHTCTVEIPAGSFLLNIQVVTTVLWGDASTSLSVGDDDAANGWFDDVDLAATDLLVGEVLDISNAENWGATQGAYLVAATGRKGRTTAGVDSGVYYGAASEVIGVVSVTTPSDTAGRTQMVVTYVTPTLTAATTS